MLRNSKWGCCHANCCCGRSSTAISVEIDQPRHTILPSGSASNAAQREQRSDRFGRRFEREKANIGRQNHVQPSYSGWLLRVGDGRPVAAGRCLIGWCWAFRSAVRSDPTHLHRKSPEVRRICLSNHKLCSGRFLRSLLLSNNYQQFKIKLSSNSSNLSQQF